ncbi:MAG: hypothetical protein H6Q30_3041 [Bacteroidetes bacterium]|nr:hypothetical protein [Bacteroidota bacterium]
MCVHQHSMRDEGNPEGGYGIARATIREPASSIVGS